TFCLTLLRVMATAPVGTTVPDRERLPDRSVGEVEYEIDGELRLLKAGVALMTLNVLLVPVPPLRSRADRGDRKVARIGKRDAVRGEDAECECRRQSAT